LPKSQSVGTGIANGVDYVKPSTQRIPSIAGRRRTVMEMTSLQDLWVENLKDLYSAENQLLKALPRVAKKVENNQLRQALQLHIKETEAQVDRLERIFKKIGEKPTGKKCHGMEGLIEEAKELMGEDAEPEVLDAGLIVDCQKVEHYEIAGYGSAVTFAKLLGDEESARLLAQTLDEEERTDKKLTQIAESTINVQAARGD
jgi:ferritin-like metal-binding protein YciE